MLDADAKEPTFLRKLKSQYGGGGSGGRVEGPAPIPRKLKVHDDDDEPTYIDEESNEVISKEQYETLMHGAPGKNGKDKDKESSGKEEGPSEAKPGEEGRTDNKQRNITEIGTGPRKRKQAKVVGEETAPEQTQTKDTKKAKRTKKKVKLSFDEE